MPPALAFGRRTDGSRGKMGMPKANLSDATWSGYGISSVKGLSTADRHLLDRYGFQVDGTGLQGSGSASRSNGGGRVSWCLEQLRRRRRCFSDGILLLVRKARSLWIKESMAVGCRQACSCWIAFRVKADAAQRRERERRSAELAGWIQAVRRGMRINTQVVVHKRRSMSCPRGVKQTDCALFCRRALGLSTSHTPSASRARPGPRAGWRERQNMLRRPPGPARRDAGRSTFASVVFASPGASACSSVMFEAAIRSHRQVTLGEAAGGQASTTAAGVLVNKDRKDHDDPK